MRPLLAKPPRHQVYLSADLHTDHIHSSAYANVLPDDILQENYASFAISSLPFAAVDAPIALPDDDAVKRAISTFDRNMTVDSHKVGIIFVGDGQTAEDKILANIMGSADYTSFITSLGTLMPLKGATFNTQGLDREFDSDGQFTIAWRDRISELVFHITTMMPTDLERDPMSTNKKRHIGNDFVNIVWNNSGLPFGFGTFPSAFNYVYIVITPTVRASFVDTRTSFADDDNSIVDFRSDTKSVLSSAPTAPDQVASANIPALERRQTAFSHRYYHVQVLSAPDFPSISPASEGKVISGKALPHFVRLLALNASVFSLVWANRDVGETVSSWRNRLREIKRLREKYGLQPYQTNSDTLRPPATMLITERPNSTVGSAVGILGGAQGRQTPQMRDSMVSNASGFKRHSAKTTLSDETNNNGSRTSLVSSPGATGDPDRQSSTG